MVQGWPALLAHASANLYLMRHPLTPFPQSAELLSVVEQVVHCTTLGGAIPVAVLET